MMNGQPLVSILMPVFNVSTYLDEAIASVRQQTYPNWELLVVDDGSSDQSPSIIERHAAADSRIRPLRHPERLNLGASASRNLALSEARGDLVAMLDGDDVWLPRKLEEQVDLLRRHPEVDVLYGSTLYWHSWTGLSRDSKRDWICTPVIPHLSVVRPPALLIAILNGEAGVPCTCSMIVRRRAIEAIGGFENEFRRVYTDQVFYAKLFLGATVLTVDTCWDQYRQHAESSCALEDAAGTLNRARLRYLHWLRHHLQSQPGAHPKLWWAVHRAIWREEYPASMKLAAAATVQLRRAKRLLTRPLLPPRMATRQP